MRFLRALARACLNAINKVVEVRGGLMLVMPIPITTPAQQTSDKHAGLVNVCNPVQVKETWALQRNVVTKRLQQGHVMLCLEDHGELRSYCWVSLAGSSNDVFFGIMFEVPEDAIYIWDCATLPRYRKHGYYKTVLKAILSSHPGITSAYVAVDQLNHISRRALDRAGFRLCFRYWGIRFLRRQALCIALWDKRLLTLKQALAQLTQAPVATID